MSNANLDTTYKISTLIREATEYTPTGVSFFSIRDYSNKKGEVADYLINVGADYGKAKEKDFKFLTNLKVEKLKSFNSSIANLKKARLSLLKSLVRPDKNRSEGQTKAYKGIRSNVKINNKTGKLYIYGFKISKRVKVENPEIKIPNSTKLTIAKNEIKKFMKSSKFSNFIVSSAKSMSVSGKTIIIETKNNETMVTNIVKCKFRRHCKNIVTDKIEVKSPTGKIVTIDFMSCKSYSKYFKFSTMMADIDRKGIDSTGDDWFDINLTKEQMREFLELSFTNK